MGRGGQGCRRQSRLTVSRVCPCACFRFMWHAWALRTAQQLTARDNRSTFVTRCFGGFFPCVVACGSVQTVDPRVPGSSPCRGSKATAATRSGHSTNCRMVIFRAATWDATTCCGTVRVTPVGARTSTQCSWAWNNLCDVLVSGCRAVWQSAGCCWRFCVQPSVGGSAAPAAS